MEDTRITCSDCGRSFIFSAKEQKFYEDNGYVPPKRCRYCRTRRKENIERRKNNGYKKENY